MKDKTLDQLEAEYGERHAEPDVDQVISVRAADIQPEPLAWLWPGRIPLGKLTMIAGDPGLGKSLLTIDIAARVSSGGVFPVDECPCPQGRVVILSAEDDPADTIRPRLDAAAADVTRVQVLLGVRSSSAEQGKLERVLSLKQDIDVMDEYFRTYPDISTVIIDPVSAYMEGTDTHRNSDVRTLLTPLAKLAQRHRVAVIAVTHLNKGVGNNALYRMTGSLGFVAAARAAFIVTADKEDKERRLLLPAKSNLSKEISGLAFSVDTNDEGSPYLLWEAESVDISASSALDVDTTEKRTARSDAQAFLRNFLSNGPKKATEVEAGAGTNQISPRTLRRAKKALEIQVSKSGFLRSA